jgi:hypothetical protein
MTKEIRMTNDEISYTGTLGISDLGFRPSFVIRSFKAGSFVIPPALRTA